MSRDLKLPARDAIEQWFQDNPEGESTSREMSRATGNNETAIYRAMKAMEADGLLTSRVEMRLSAKGTTCRQVVYTATDAIAPPRARGLSIVASALTHRGLLLDAWWPIASNDERRTAA